MATTPSTTADRHPTTTSPAAGALALVRDVLVGSQPVDGGVLMDQASLDQNGPVDKDEPVDKDVRWLSDVEQTAWRAYLDGTRLLIQALDHQLSAESELSFTDYELLVRLSEAAQGRLRMRDLADATLSTRSGITRAVTRAERAGWVKRVVCDDDRRGMNAELTEAGREKLAASAPGHVAAVRANLLDLLTPEQLGQLTEIGGRLRQHLAPRSG